MKVATSILFLLSFENTAGSKNDRHKHFRGSSNLHQHNYDDFNRFLGGGDCLQNDCECFRCLSATPKDDKVEVVIGKNGCKNDSISWMCCVGADKGEGNCALTVCDGKSDERFPKCQDVKNSITVTIPADSKTFTINTHDGKSSGTGSANHDACGGSEGSPNKPEKTNGCGVSGYCLIEFDLEDDCNFFPERVPTMAPTIGEVLTPPPSAGYDTDEPTFEPTTGEETFEPTMGEETFEPTMGEETFEPTMGEETFEPTMGEVLTPPPSAGYDTDEPTSGNPEPNPPTFMTGDPHIKTFGGETYDFHGGCDLVLLHNPTFNHGQGLEIHVRTKITRWWSSIESAVVRIGDDVLEIKAGIQDRPYWINGKQNKFLTSRNFPFTVGGFSGRYRYLNDMALQYKITLPDDQAILIKSVKNMLRVELDGAEKDYFGNSLGLMGSFDGKFLGRDGVTEFENMNEFGLEWQVKDTDPQLFHTPEGPQYPETCSMPELEGPSVSRRLGTGTVSESAAKEACARVAKDEFDNCVSDVFGMDDIAAAEAY